MLHKASRVIKKYHIVFQGHLSHFKVIQTTKSPVWPRFQHFRTKASVSIHRRRCYDAQSFEEHRICALLFCQGHPSHHTSMSRSQRLNKVTRLVAAIKSLRFAITVYCKCISYSDHIHKLCKSHLNVNLDY